MQFYDKKQTLHFKNVSFVSGFTLAGPKEKQGKLGSTFDLTLEDDKFGEKTFEKAERKMFEYAVSGAIAKANLQPNDIDTIIGGDLLNQIVSVSFAAKKFKSSFLGLYNACGTYVESLIIGSFLTEFFSKNVLCVSGSHFSTAERQYRYPLELGVLRSPVTQWTATGVGASILQRHSDGCPKIVSATVGRVMDYGIMDVNNMGAAMAPAAKDTFTQYFTDTGKKPSDFDMIATGDLGKLGKEILIDLMEREGYDFNNNYIDCGAELFYEKQKTYMGGSGAACSALVTNGWLYNNLKKGNIKNLLLVGTGALMSPTTSFQGESIPAIAHLVEIEMGQKES
ncbi:MAG TPA: stage V sporulation protein AD [Eubacteriales bacterium]|nr:stage V sporulation protein AD [Eubacteriales bacterium]